MGEQRCDDSLLCPRDKPLNEHLVEHHAVSGLPFGGPSDKWTGVQYRTCETCNTTSSKDLDARGAFPSYYPPVPDFQVKLQPDRGFGKFVRAEKHEHDTKSLSDVDDDEERWRSEGLERKDPVEKMQHRALLDKQLENLPAWIAHQHTQRIQQAAASVPPPFVSAPCGTMPFAAMPGQPGGGFAAAASALPIPSYSAPHPPALMTPPALKKTSRLSFTDKTFIPRGPKSQGLSPQPSTTNSSAASSRPATPAVAPSVQRPQAPFVQKRRDSFLAKPPKTPKTNRRRSNQRLDQLPIRKMSLEQYVVPVRGQKKKVEEEILGGEISEEKALSSDTSEETSSEEIHRTKERTGEKRRWTVVEKLTMKFEKQMREKALAEGMLQDG